MKKVVVSIALFLVVSIILCACSQKTSGSNSGGGTPKPVTNAPLTGTFWQLAHAREVTYKPAKGVRKVYMTLDDSNKLTGFGGCNNLVGSYEASAGKPAIKFKAASTQMMCTGDAMKIENALSAALTAAVEYRIEGKTLWLYNDSGTPVADFVVGEN